MNNTVGMQTAPLNLFQNNFKNNYDQKGNLRKCTFK